MPEIRSCSLGSAVGDARVDIWGYGGAGFPRFYKTSARALARFPLRDLKRAIQWILPPKNDIGRAGKPARPDGCGHGLETFLPESARKSAVPAEEGQNFWVPFPQPKYRHDLKIAGTRLANGPRGPDG